MFTFRKNGHFYEKVGKKGEPVCIDDEIPFEIPDSWELIKLGYLISIITGTSYKKGDITSEGIRILRGGNIQNTEILFLDDDVFLPDSYYNELKEIKKGDVIIVASTGSKKVIGKPGFVKKDYQNISIGAFLRICRPHITYLSEYIQFIFGSEYYKKHIRKLSQGTNINNIKKEYIENLLIPLPPLNEQNRIIDEFKKISPLIEEYKINKEKLDKLNKEFPEQLKSSILQEAIQGKLVPQDSNDEPASVLLKKIREEKERLIKEKKIKKNKKESFIYKRDNHFYEKIGDNEPVCIDDEIPFDVPDSWEWVRLDSVCKYIQRGKSPKYSEIKKFPVVAQKCNQWSGFSIEKAKFIDPKTVDSYNEERILQNKDIMWNSTGLGTLGRVGLYDESVNKYGWAVADSHVTIIRPFPEYILQEFIYLFLASPTVQLVIESKAGGSTKQKELNLSTIKDYLIPLAPYNEQKKIIEKVYNLNKLLE